MKCIKNILTKALVFAPIALTGMVSRAEDTQTLTEADSSHASYQPFTIGAEIGTLGAGGAVNWRFSDHFGVGAAFDYFSYNYHTTIEGIDFDNNRLRLMSEPVTLNLYPSKNHSFHLSIGALFNQNQLTGSKTGTVDLDGTPYTGTVNLEIKQQPLNPYVSIGGNLYFDKGHHVSLGGELGVVYTGDPQVSLSAPGAPPSAIAGEESQIHNYAKKAQFWPIAKLSLNYSF